MDRHEFDPGYADRWLDALLAGRQVEAVVALGHLADDAFQAWRATPAGQGVEVAHEHVTHPTAPESGAGGDPAKLARLMQAMLENWNAALQRLAPRILHPDVERPLVLYGDRLQPSDYVTIPERDLPAGLPAWMRSRVWADRKGQTVDARRATIVVTVPADQRPWKQG